MYRSLAPRAVLLTIGTFSVLSAVMLLGSAGVSRHIAVAAPAPAAHGGKIHPVVNPIHGEYIVTLHPVDHARVHEIATRLAHEHDGTIIDIYTHTILGFAVKMTEPHALALSQDPAVASVYQDGAIHETASETPTSWGLDRIDQRKLPLNNTYDYTGTGAGVHVYIVDTGILYSNKDFGGRAKLGFDAFADNQKGKDCNGHGTHVAGIAAGKKYGVAKSATLFSVRVLSCTGSGTTSGVIKGIDWISANAKKPAVVNMSLGGGFSALLDAAVTKSVGTGITYVAAAGNDNRNACSYSPAAATAAITVAAIDSTDKKATFSNHGKCVDLFAPGVSIDSDWIGSDTATLVTSGTSMAAPFVTGEAAVYLGEHPTATPAQVTAAILGNATKGEVLNPGTDTPNLLEYTG